ncbi:MAG: hypothetical protein ACE5J2_05390 [Nitrososphaerales archaeon]
MNNVLPLLLLFGTILSTGLTTTSAQTSETLTTERIPRDIIFDTGMQINLVLIGDSWSEEDKNQITTRLLQSYTPIISSKDEPAGVRYNYTYNFKSEPEQVSEELFEFIDSIGVKTTVPAPIESSIFAQQPELATEGLVYKLINAYRVEEKLADLEREEGYTIYFFKPSKQELGYLHSYGAFTTDPDTNRAFVQEGMMGFGGKHRFYFIDLTSGPWIYPYLPISETQAFSEYHENIHDLEEKEEYYNLIADLVNDAIRLLFTPSYLYPPVYKLNYRMQVFLIDMTSGRIFHDIAEDYIKKESIEQAFVKLIPYAQWQSEIKGQTFDSLPRELQRAILKSLSFPSGSGKATLIKSSDFIIELRKWVQETLTEEEIRLQEEESKTTVFVPTILFVFDTDAYVDRVPVVGAAIPDPADNKRPCCAIVAVNKHALTDFGTGLSTLAVHEMGHVLGLRHPHDGYGELKGEFNSWFFDWSYTPMTYASPTILGCGLAGERCGLVVTEFGRFNIDAMDRGLVLSLLDQVQFNLYDFLLELEGKGYDKDNLPSDIESNLTSIDSDVERSKELFTEMNYFKFETLEVTGEPSDLMDDAFDFALNAFTNSESLLEESGRLPEIGPKSSVSGINTLDISEPLFVDDNGVESNIQEISESVLIKSSVSSRLAQKINFTAIIQIKDSEGFTISLTARDFSISSNENAEPSLSWIFERPGQFSIEIFLWERLDKPVPLSPVQKAEVILVR